MTGLFPSDIEQKSRLLIEKYTASGKRIVTAESCTGGLIAGALTEIPGSSAVVERGFVIYSNEAKTQLLDVPPELIERVGAVSEQVAAAMVRGALAHSSADIAVSVTGIAGPNGGTEEKPVGLVYLGIATRGHEPLVKRCIFSQQSRSGVRLHTMRAALDLLEQALQDG